MTYVSLWDFLSQSEIDDCVAGTATDVTAGVAAAVAACQASKQILHVPAGTYHVSGANGGVVLTAPITIIGAGRDRAIIKNLHSTGPCFKGFAYCHIERLTIDNNGSTGAAYLQGGLYASSLDLHVTGIPAGGVGIGINGSTHAMLENIQVSNCAGTAMKLGDLQTNYVTVNHCQLELVGGLGLDMDNCNNCRFNGLYFDGGGGQSFAGLIDMDNCHQVGFRDLATEVFGSLTGTHLIDVANSKAISFDGSRINWDQAANGKNTFRLYACENVAIRDAWWKAKGTNLRFAQLETTNTRGVRLENIYTYLNHAGTLVNCGAGVHALKVSNVIDQQQAAQTALYIDASSYLLENLIQPISLAGSNGSLINCSGTISGAGAAGVARLNS